LRSQRLDPKLLPSSHGTKDQDQEGCHHNGGSARDTISNLWNTRMAQITKLPKSQELTNATIVQLAGAFALIRDIDKAEH
jgi:hypothetical protein